jgi:hypothetical protein
VKGWVGFGAIADNLINIGDTLAKGNVEDKQTARGKH